MNLKYVVITSVTRDDLKDEGSLQFVNTIKNIRKLTPQIKIETLLPLMRVENLLNIVKVQPEVIGYNIETIPRLYKIMRPHFRYKKGLEYLKKIKSLNKHILVKSGIMVGLGESKEEVVKVMQDLKECGVDIITIGQYFRPPGGEVSPVNYISPQEFEHYELIGYQLGFKKVFSGPYIRSSYHSWTIFNS
jgi:lipoic acid synthetase